MQRVRLAIIGTGIAAQTLHWPSLERLGDRFQIVALCNRTREKAEAFAEFIGGSPRITTDYHELLAWPDVDAVDILLPIALNGPVAVDALRAGKHVAVEKPIAGAVDAGRAVLEEAQRHPDRTLLVAENVRYEPRYREARRLIDDGRIGRPVMLHADILAPLNPTSPYLATVWRETPQHLGGYLSDGGVHHAAALQMLAGPVRAVQGIVTSFDPQRDPTDTLLANLLFESGAVGHLTYSVGVPHGEITPFAVYGTEGSLLVYPDRVILRVGREEEVIPIPARPNGFDLELADFHRSIVDGTPPRSGAREGLDDLLVIDAVFGSWREGRLIGLR